VTAYRHLVRNGLGYDYRSPCPLYCSSADARSWREAARNLVARAALLEPYVPAGPAREALQTARFAVAALPEPAGGDAVAQAEAIGGMVDAMLELADAMEQADAAVRAAGGVPPDPAVEVRTSAPGSMLGTLGMFAATGLVLYGGLQLVRYARARARVGEAVADIVEEETA
jgi:hypothetical protein